jgi:HPr kinase/phosphorylase
MIDLTKFAKKLNLEVIYIPEEIIINDYSFSVTGTTNGYYESNDLITENHILVLGKLDETLFQKRTNEENELWFSKLTNIDLIVINDNFSKDLIIGFVKQYKKILLHSSVSSREIITSINYYISYKLSERIRVHATLVNIYGEGVLIVGKSGIGKSELAIELIKNNHQFIGDDAIDLIKIDGSFIGRSAPITRNFLEVRGLGIINVQQTFGIQSLLKETKVNFVVELVKLEDVRSTIDRLGSNYSTYELKNGTIPKVQIPVSSGKNIASIVETAVNIYKLKKYDNYIALVDIQGKK